MVESEASSRVQAGQCLDPDHCPCRRGMLLQLLHSEYDCICRIHAADGSYELYAGGGCASLPSAAYRSYNDGIERLIHMLVPAGQAPALIQHTTLAYVSAALETMPVYTLTFDAVYPDEVRRKQLRYLWADPEKTAILLTRRDIQTEISPEQQQLETLKAELEAARASNHIKDELLSRLSREIRTPANAILGLSQIISESAEDADSVRRCAGKTHDACVDLLHELNGMQDISLLETGGLTLAQKPFSFSSMIDNISTIIASQAELAQIDCHFSTDSSCQACYVGDEMRVQQLLIKLLDNAVKFNRPGGCVSLLVRQISTEKDDTAILEMQVSDTGIGISPAFIPRLFTAFTQEYTGPQSRYGGCGLGLPIARGLARQMGGDITVVSQPDAGSTFTATIRLTLLSRVAFRPFRKGFSRRSSALTGKACCYARTTR